MCNFIHGDLESGWVIAYGASRGLVILAYVIVMMKICDLCCKLSTKEGSGYWFVSFLHLQALLVLHLSIVTLLPVEDFGRRSQDALRAASIST